MNAIYNHAVKQISTIRKDLATFESNLSTSPLSLQGSIAANLTQLNKTVDEYEKLSQSNTNLDEKAIEKASTRISTLRNDISQARQHFQQLKTQRDEATQESNRSELFKRSNAKSNVSDNPFDAVDSSNPAKIDYKEGLYKETESLSRGNAILDDIIAQGSASLEQLIESNQMLDRARQQLTGVLGTLGVSQETIRTISRVARTDKFIFYSGSFLLFLLLIMIYRWMK